VKGQAASGSNREGESTEAGRRGGAARSSGEGLLLHFRSKGWRICCIDCHFPGRQRH